MSVFDETIEQRKARLRAEDKEAEAARAKQLEGAAAQTRGVNERYFAQQKALALQCAEQNAKNAATQKEREKSANERNAAEAKARIEELHGKVNKPQEGFLDVHGLVEAPRKASVSRQPLPEKYPAGDPRRDMSEELIIRMGMEPDPKKPALKK